MQLCEHFSIDDKIENHQTENVSYIKNVRYLFIELLHNLYHKTNDWGPWAMFVPVLWELGLPSFIKKTSQFNVQTKIQFCASN